MSISSKRLRCGIVLGCSLAWIAASAAPTKATLVVCSPGSPGTTEEARPAMEALAAAAGAKAGVALDAVYDPSDEGGVAKLQQAGLALVSMPFFLAHEKELGLHARLSVVPRGRPALERWSLVAQKGKVTRADQLAGFTIATSVAFAPAFVRGDVLGGFGPLPASAKITRSTAVLSALRRAANGEPVAVVLNGAEEASLASLPFATKLEVVAHSPEMPAAVVATIDSRLPAATWTGLEAALLGLRNDRTGATALDGIQVAQFAPLDEKALDAARKAYADAPR